MTSISVPARDGSANVALVVPPSGPAAIEYDFSDQEAWEVALAAFLAALEN